MGPAKGKKDTTVKDDSLFGLLLSYKSFNTYIRVMESREKSEMAVIITGNPASWKHIPPGELADFRQVKRLEIGTDRLFIKYILPEQILKVYGPFAGIKIAADKMQIDNMLHDRGYYIIKTSSRQSAKVFSWVKKMVGLSPQRKYEIHEICIAETQG